MMPLLIVAWLLIIAAWLAHGLTTFVLNLMGGVLGYGIAYVAWCKWDDSGRR